MAAAGSKPLLGKFADGMAYIGELTLSLVNIKSDKSTERNTGLVVVVGGLVLVGYLAYLNQDKKTTATTTSSTNASTAKETKMSGTGNNVVVGGAGATITVTTNTMAPIQDQEAKHEQQAVDFEYASELVYVVSNRSLKTIQDKLSEKPEAEHAKYVTTPDSYNSVTAIMAAAATGDKAKLEYLLGLVPEAERAAALKARSSSGDTAFMMACGKSGTRENVEYLWGQIPEKSDREWNLQQADNFGRTAWLLAAKNGKTEIVHFIWSKIPKPQQSLYLDKTDNSGKTAAMLAAEGGHTDTLQTLLLATLSETSEAKRWSCFTNKDQYGRNMLMLAASHGHLATCEFLVANTPPEKLAEYLQEKDSNGWTAEEIARKTGGGSREAKAVAAFLQQKMQETQSTRSGSFSTTDTMQEMLAGDAGMAGAADDITGLDAER